MLVDDPGDAGFFKEEELHFGGEEGDSKVFIGGVNDDAEGAVEVGIFELDTLPHAEPFPDAKKEVAAEDANFGPRGSGGGVNGVGDWDSGLAGVDHVDMLEDGEGAAVEGTSEEFFGSTIASDNIEVGEGAMEIFVGFLVDAETERGCGVGQGEAFSGSAPSDFYHDKDGEEKTGEKNEGE